MGHETDLSFPSLFLSTMKKCPLVAAEKIFTIVRNEFAW